MNNRFQNALRHQPQAVPPIWFMRQAGRYHSHYQELRKKHSFMDLCKDPELASEVALGPVMEFDFDAAILFSDLLFPLEALGMGLSYPVSGPELSWHLDSSTIGRLAEPDRDSIARLSFQRDAVALTRKKLPASKSLIGFVGGPFTLFAYAVEGRHGKGLIETKKRLSLFQPFCSRLLPLLISNISLQLEGGAEAVMLFDTAAGELSPQMFHELVAPALQAVFQAHPRKTGYYSFGTQAAHLRHPGILSPQLGGIGIDHRWNLAEVFRLCPDGFVQGNFDQSLLHLERDTFLRQLDAWLLPIRSLSPEQRAGWVCGLGHGVLPQTPEENVRLFVRHVREVLS